MHIYLASHLDNAQGSKFVSEIKKKFRSPYNLPMRVKLSLDTLKIRLRGNFFVDAQEGKKNVKCPKIPTESVIFFRCQKKIQMHYKLGQGVQKNFRFLKNPPERVKKISDAPKISPKVKKMTDALKTLQRGSKKF